jgi:hypothetical protein
MARWIRPKPSEALRQETDLPGVTLRDFLYLDVDRAKSLLSQLRGGVVQSVVERLSERKGGKAGAALFNVLELSGDLVKEKGSEQTKALQDALFLLFEEAAEESGVLTQPPCVTDPSSWQSGEVHRMLAPGQLIRLSVPTRVLDSVIFEQQLKAFAEWPRLMANISGHQALQKLRPEQRTGRLKSLAGKLAEEWNVEVVKNIGEVVGHFMSGQIVSRQFPCGIDHPDFALVGILLGKPGYLQEERESLFGKYGFGTTTWTVVSQIAAVPEPFSGPPDIDGLTMMQGDQIRREQLEEMASRLIGHMQAVGIAEGPIYPAISVSPIAIYREFKAIPN